MTGPGKWRQPNPGFPLGPRQERQIRMRTLLLPALCLAPLTAQSIVSPTHFTNAEGNSYSADGLGTAGTPNRYLELHGDLEGTPTTFARISFRRDGESINTAPVPAYTVLCDVFLSTAASTTAAPNANF